MKKINIFGLPVTAGATIHKVLDELLDAVESKKQLLVTFVNPYAYRAVKTNSKYLKSLSQHDLILSDGIGIKFILDLYCGEKTNRISFDNTSLATPIFQFIKKHKLRVVLVGGKPNVTLRASEIIKNSIADIEVVGCLDGYTQNAQNYKKITQLTPDIIICGMGIPLQENFGVELKKFGFKGCIFTCGGFFDQIIQGDINYYPAWIDQYDLRWFYRLYKEPRRLAYRYFVGYQRFIFLAMLAKLRIIDPLK